MQNNSLIVVQCGNHPLLYRDTLSAHHLHWVSGVAPTAGLRLTARIRYRQPDQPCQIRPDGQDSWLVEFDQAQRAVTPGQSVVFYDGEVCLGGGVIETSWNREIQPVATRPAPAVNA